MFCCWLLLHVQPRLPDLGAVPAGTTAVRSLTAAAQHLQTKKAALQGAHTAASQKPTQAPHMPQQQQEEGEDKERGSGPGGGQRASGRAGASPPRGSNNSGGARPDGVVLHVHADGDCEDGGDGSRSASPERISSGSLTSPGGDGSRASPGTLTSPGADEWGASPGAGSEWGAHSHSHSHSSLSSPAHQSSLSSPGARSLSPGAGSNAGAQAGTGWGPDSPQQPLRRAQDSTPATPLPTASNSQHVHSGSGREHSTMAVQGGGEEEGLDHRSQVAAQAGVPSAQPSTPPPSGAATQLGTPQPSLTTPLSPKSGATSRSSLPKVQAGSAPASKEGGASAVAAGKPASLLQLVERQLHEEGAEEEGGLRVAAASDGASHAEGGEAGSSQAVQVAESASSGPLGSATSSTDGTQGQASGSVSGAGAGAGAVEGREEGQEEEEETVLAREAADKVAVVAPALATGHAAAAKRLPSYMKPTASSRKRSSDGCSAADIAPGAAAAHSTHSVAVHGSVAHGAHAAAHVVVHPPTHSPAAVLRSGGPAAGGSKPTTPSIASKLSSPALGTRPASATTATASAAKKAGVAASPAATAGTPASAAKKPATPAAGQATKTATSAAKLAATPPPGSPAARAAVSRTGTPAKAGTPAVGPRPAGARPVHTPVSKGGAMASHAAGSHPAVTGTAGGTNAAVAAEGALSAPAPAGTPAPAAREADGGKGGAPGAAPSTPSAAPAPAPEAASTPATGVTAAAAASRSAAASLSGAATPAAGPASAVNAGVAVAGAVAADPNGGSGLPFGVWRLVRLKKAAACDACQGATRV